MSIKTMNNLALSLALTANAFLISGCTRKAEQARAPEPTPRVEAALPANGLLPSISPTPTPSPAPRSTTPPDPAEIRNAVARVFEKAATSDVAGNTSAVGDFNGDGSEDLAVVVRASEGALDTINNELANWLLEEPQNLSLAQGASPPRPPAKHVRAERGENLLAIIHGVGSQGWRAPEAKQTFLLKNGSGSQMLAQSRDELRKSSGKLPPLRGDVLKETIHGKSGFVLWTGAKYAWWVIPAE
jgi:hypothetical protein